MQQVAGELQYPEPAQRAPGIGGAHSLPLPLTVGVPRTAPPAGRAFHRGRRGQKRGRLTGIGLAAVAGMTAFIVATEGGREARQSPQLMQALDAIALALGFGVSQVEIVGQKNTTDTAIQDTLDLANAGSLLRLDSSAVRQRIERLPWIDTATVTRVFPDRLRIVVTERQPFARWHRGDRTFLIDRTGRVLAPIQPGAVLPLPLVTGEGAAEQAEALLSELERYPSILSRLEAADRVDGRRWTLRLEDGPALLLPADNIGQALGRLAADGVLASAAGMAGQTIDARLPDRMIVRRSEPRPAALPARNPAAADKGAAAPPAGEGRDAQRG